MSCKFNSSLMNKPILMKLYTVAVYDLRMCMKEVTQSELVQGS